MAAKKKVVTKRPYHRKIKQPKPVVESITEQVPAATPEPKDPKQPFGPGLCDVCGNPVAPGQTWVCKDHVRSN